MEWNLQKGLSLDRLKGLLDVKNAGGISKAAPGAVGKQNQIGRQIRDLERYFGARLVEKRGRQIFLTPQGDQLAGMAAQIGALITDFRAEVSGVRREFSIAAGGSLYDDLLARRVCKLKPLKLRLRLSEITQPKIFEALQDSQIDAAIAWGLPRGSHRLAQMPLGILNYAIYGHRSLLKGRDLAKRVFSLPTVIVEYRDISVVLDSMRLTDEVVYVDENITAFGAISSGEYVGVLPCIIGERLSRGQFRQLDLPFLREFSRKISYFWNPRYAAVRQFNPSQIKEIGATFKVE